MGGGSEKASADMKASAAANSTLQQAVQREYRQYVNLLPITDNDPSMHATPPSGCSALHQALKMPKLIGKIHEMPRQNQFSAPTEEEAELSWEILASFARLRRKEAQGMGSGFTAPSPLQQQLISDASRVLKLLKKLQSQQT